MEENYEALFQRIRAKCLQRRWHGPDINNPFEIVAQERALREKQLERMRQIREQKGRAFVAASYGATRFWYDRNGKQYAINLDTDLDSFPLQTEFEYPPATEEQVALYEKNLGYSLPPLLRALYTTVANGGFGPGYGLDGVHARAALPDGSPMTRSHRSVDLAIYLRRYGSSKYFEFPWYVWPESLVNLCHWGCGYFSQLDCVSGRVFYGGAGQDGYGLHAQANSLEEWLDLWIKGVNLEKMIYGGEQDDE